MSISKVIDNGYCIGCGACTLIDNENINIEVREAGFYEARMNKENVSDDILNKICPFSEDSKNEDELSEALYNNSFNEFDSRVGYYNSVYAGNVKSKRSRETSSSGGMTTWFAEKLMQKGEVEAVIHVGSSGEMFGYRVSESIDELRNRKNKKSRYYPVTLDELLCSIQDSNKKYLFIGIPCFVKTIRLLQSEGYLKNIKFCLSLLCGHMKSTYFSENIGWQLGFKPGELKSLDFRVKKSGFKSSDYFVEAQGANGNNRSRRNNELFGSNWGHGFFKHLACDACDDIAGELADATFGDAWLNEYTNDYLGTNIFIIRNPVLLSIMNNNDEIEVKEVSVSTFEETQAGNYRHRRDGLIVRQRNSSNWFPKKRLSLGHEVNHQRETLYLYRTRLSKISTERYILARKIGYYPVYKLLMFFPVVKYNIINFGYLGVFRNFVRSLIPNSLIRVMKKKLRKI